MVQAASSVTTPGDRQQDIWHSLEIGEAILPKGRRYAIAHNQG
ncbi:hypothetical protein ACE1AT_10875 [Pelatocladus sp. BLCC-F211]